MHLIRKFRTPALMCAFAVLLCDLVSRPFVNMGIADDGTYILIAQKLAATGHIVYSGNTTPFLGWQLYLAAAFIKLFGFSFTTVRMSTLLVAMAIAFVLQRTLVRAGINERNATIGTLTLVLSPLFLTLSSTFMSDIFGLFAVLCCLYCCLRTLQSSTARAAITWLCLAVSTNAICGTSRQIAWLGVLVMVPSTLWLLRFNRRVFFASLAANIGGIIFVFACLHWFNQQPYNVHDPILPKSLPIGHTLAEFVHTFLDMPFFLLPVFAIFIPVIRKSRPRVIAILAAIAIAYALIAAVRSHVHPNALLEPIDGAFVSPEGIYFLYVQGWPPTFLHTPVRIIFTIASIGGLLGLIAAFTQRRTFSSSLNSPSTSLSWTQLGILLIPFSVANILLLVPRATNWLTDRYLLILLTVVLMVLVRYYQGQVRHRLPLTSVILVAIMAVYAVAVTYNLFSLDRARVALAAEMRSAGVPDTSFDDGWEYNFGTELAHAPSLNYPTIFVPANFYVPTPAPPPGVCTPYYADEIPHVHPLYGISFDPNACYGPAPFAPIHYSRWLASQPGTLYVVNYLPPVKP